MGWCVAARALPPCASTMSVRTLAVAVAVAVALALAPTAHAAVCDFCKDHPTSCDIPGQYCPPSLAYPKKCEVREGRGALVVTPAPHSRPVSRFPGWLLLPEPRGTDRVSRGLLLPRGLLRAVHMRAAGGVPGGHPQRDQGLRRAAVQLCACAGGLLGVPDVQVLPQQEARGAGGAVVRIARLCTRAACTVGEG